MSEEGNNGAEEVEDVVYNEVIQRTLRPIQLELDITSRFEASDEVTVTEPFDPNAIPEEVEEHLIDEEMEMNSNFERLPRFMQIHPNAIFNSSIVGWMQMPNREMILATTKQWTQEERYIPPMTDLLFPVCVRDEQELPIPSQDFSDQHFQDYNPGMYLALVLDSDTVPRLVKFTLEIDPPNNPTFNVITHRAVLKKYLIYMENDITFIEPQTKFNQIVDKLNEDYRVFGLYAGGPLPPRDNRTGGPRLCWNQPRPQQTMSGIFRFDSFEGRNRINGIICSRDALLEVKEKMSERELRFSSLLKESTFVISDGDLTYAVNNGSKTWDYRGIYVPPNLLVATEGFSSLNISVRESDTTFRFACYWLENNSKKPLCIKWTQFQQDFSGQIVVVDDTPVFTEIMRKEDFRNYMEYPFIPWIIDVIPYLQFNTTLIFCLARKSKFSPHIHEYRDHIHVYGQLPYHGRTEKPNNYFYLSTLCNIFEVQKRNKRFIPSYKQTIVFNRERLYPFEGIEERLSPHLDQNEINIAVNLLRKFDEMAHNVYQNASLKKLFQRFMTKANLTNQTQIGIDRFTLLKDFTKPHH